MSSTHHHPHVHIEDMGQKRLVLAIGINVLLTIAQIVGGILSGSLALVADALHNFSDAGSLLIALMARRISLKPADDWRTFGYRRAETVGALINVTTLILIGLYLVFEAVMRFFNPEPILGWIVVIVAGIAFIIDLATAMLTYALSKDNLNFKAAFVHNVTDALGSIIAIASGALILLYELYIFDAIATLAIAGYVLVQGISMLKDSIRILMESVPKDIEIVELIGSLESIDHVEEIHHVHVWELDEHHRAFEAHIVIDQKNIDLMESLKTQIKQRLKERYEIYHSTLEFEVLSENEDKRCSSPSTMCESLL